MTAVSGTPYGRWLAELRAKAREQGWGDIRSNTAEGQTIVVTFVTGIQVRKNLDDFNTPEAPPQCDESDHEEGTDDRYPGRFVNHKPCGWGDGNQMIRLGNSIMRVNEAADYGLTYYHGGERKWMPNYHSEVDAAQLFRTDRTKRF